MEYCVNINLFDDYRQKPEYKYNCTTHFRISVTVGQLLDEELFSVREQLLSACINWKHEHQGVLPITHNAYNEVQFSRSWKNDELDVIELDEPRRKCLFRHLQEHFARTLEGIKITWTMES